MGQRGAGLRVWLWISIYLLMGTTAQGSVSLPMLLVTSLWITSSLSHWVAATSQPISKCYAEAVTAGNITQCDCAGSIPSQRRRISMHKPTASMHTYVVMGGGAKSRRGRLPDPAPMDTDTAAKFSPRGFRPDSAIDAHVYAEIGADGRFTHARWSTAGTY